MSRARGLAAALIMLLILTGCGAGNRAEEAEAMEQAVLIVPPETAKPEKPAEYTPGAPVTEDGIEAEPPQEEEQSVFTLSFAGDCCLGTDHSVYGGEGTLVQVVGDDYTHPFANTLQYFGQDDFTMVNLECALTDHTTPEDKQYRFRGPPEYARILTEGGVELVTLANNHSYDYGETGYKDTKDALTAEGVDYVGDGGITLYTTQSGLVIGVFAASTHFEKMSGGISTLREQGADIVIAAFHFGAEGAYSYNTDQSYYAHLAIDYGADIVYGAHPHVLQEIEEYGGGIIYYSLGNFVFGGNRSPRDHDTAIIQQYIVKNDDGSFSLGETNRIPCDLSEYTGYNNYKPTPYAAGGEAYLRTLSKLDGTFNGPDLYVSYGDDEETEEPAEETEAPDGETEAPDGETEAPDGETEEPTGETGEPVTVTDAPAGELPGEDASVGETGGDAGESTEETSAPESGADGT